jgi:hypothetical protein
MGAIALIAFLGTFVIALIGVGIVKIYEMLKHKEEEVVEHHKEKKVSE